MCSSLRIKQHALNSFIAADLIGRRAVARTEPVAQHDTCSTIKGKQRGRINGTKFRRSDRRFLFADCARLYACQPVNVNEKVDEFYNVLNPPYAECWCVTDPGLGTSRCSSFPVCVAIPHLGLTGWYIRTAKWTLPGTAIASSAPWMLRLPHAETQ
jgi:hypothetical protein